MVYVAHFSCGYGDCVQHGILYAGTDKEKAVSVLKEFQFPDDYNNYGTLDTWKDGVLIHSEAVRE
ncbi:MAG: hypothetical protein IMZ61_16015 [Planctomycetes bacterium]|nr:hypothetical protein [Planctomycetota bacterium]